MLQKALELADKKGIGTLSMRALAKELTVEAMSLYHHVSSKESLLDAMIDEVFAEIMLPPRGGDWAEALRARARSARAALNRHPWALGLMETRTAPGPATLRHHDAVLGCLREGGFSLGATAHAYSLLDAYVYGFVLQELTLPFNTADEAAPIAASITAQMPEGAYPYLTEIAARHVLEPGYAYADEFEVGLGLVLDGVARLREAG